IGVVFVKLRPANLDVDRRRRAEIENLTDDVSRQERERHARETGREFLTHRANIIRRRFVIFAQPDLNFAVGGSNCSGVVVGGVDAASGKPMLSTSVASSSCGIIW